MKIRNVLFFRLNLLLALALLALGVAGCGTPKNWDEVMKPEAVSTYTNLPPLAAGDAVTITLTGPPTEITPLEKPINEDGTISLPDIGTIQAAGKTPGELEKYITDRYVPAIYTHLTVTVKTTSDRLYYVQGEVKMPNRMVYTGPITVTKAITSAGDFTDFANHHNVDLKRANGKIYTLDCDKILRGDLPDPPVFPGDQIYVHRRLF
jgi:polysaccharide biosynthesis/export protein VpsN